MYKTFARSLGLGWVAVGSILAIRGGLIPLPPKGGLALVIATLVVLALASGLRLISRRLGATRDVWATVVPSLGVAFFLYWLVVQSDAASTASLIIFIAVVHEVSWFVGLQLPRADRPLARGREAAAKERVGVGANVVHADDAMLVIERGAIDGVEFVRGSVRLEFEPGQRTATHAIGFTPPLVPDCTVDAEAAGGADASLRIVDPSPSGFVIEARRQGAVLEEGCTMVEFVATVDESQFAPRLRAAE